MNSVTSLFLTKNPLIQTKMYLEFANIRRSFPNLRLLVSFLKLRSVLLVLSQNDQRLPPPVKFDLSPDHTGSLPPTQVQLLDNFLN